MIATYSFRPITRETPRRAWTSSAPPMSYVLTMFFSSITFVLGVLQRLAQLRALQQRGTEMVVATQGQ